MSIRTGTPRRSAFSPPSGVANYHLQLERLVDELRREALTLDGLRRELRDARNRIAVLESDTARSRSTGST